MGYAIYEMQPHEALEAVVQRARQQGFSAVVAAGGDGTVSALANALMHVPMPLGIVPLGHGNLVARELGIPLDPAAACRVLVQAPERIDLDVIQVDKRIFLSHISMGTYARLIANTPQQSKRRFGRLASLWAISYELWRRETWPFVITVDGHPHCVHASWVMVANVAAAGPFNLSWGPHISPCDHRLDVCIIKARTPLDYLRLAGQLCGRFPAHASIITYLQARRDIAIEAPSAVPLRGDGEVVGHTAVHIRVRPQAITLLTPAKRVFPKREA
jgi:YegS/Rv2252/BmrU family lipid kinase